MAEGRPGSAELGVAELQHVAAEFLAEVDLLKTNLMSEAEARTFSTAAISAAPKPLRFSVSWEMAGEPAGDRDRPHS